MKKVIIVGVVAIFVLVGFVVFAFYITLRNKKSDVSKIKPFAEVVNQKLTTKRTVLILKRFTAPVDDSFPFLLEDGTGFGLDADLEVLVELPIGTSVLVEKAILLKGGVSGATVPYLFGRVYDTQNKKEYQFEYSWGTHHWVYQDEPFWTFPLAFWQDEAIEEKFFIDLP